MHEIELKYEVQGYIKDGKFIRTDFVVLSEKSMKKEINVELFNIETELKDAFIKAFGIEELNKREYIGLESFEIACNSMSMRLSSMCDGLFCKRVYQNT